MRCAECRHFQEVDQDNISFRRCFYGGQVVANMKRNDDTENSSPPWCPLKEKNEGCYIQRMGRYCKVHSHAL